MPNKDGGVLEGWGFVALASGLLLAMTMLLLATTGFDAEGARVVIRATARTSVVLFGAAFAASSLVTLWKSDATRWMIRNRRYLGLSFGTSHIIHYIAVMALMLLDPERFFAEEGSLGFDKYIPVVVLALQLATSFDRTAAWVGPKPWRWLHVLGSYMFCFVFIQSFGSRIGQGSLYVLFTLIAVTPLLVRVAAALRRRGRVVAS
jgi:sulfoxide reductase heme-binding subunit YedZ